MIFRPRKNRHFSRYRMAYVFLACGALLCTQNLLAGAVLLLPGLVVLYYAPKWELKIDLGGNVIRFSENVVEVHPVELTLAEIAEVRRVEEKEERKGFLRSYPEFYPFVEFRTRAGRTYRMHDIFDEDFDAEMMRAGTSAGIEMAAFPVPEA